MLKDLADIRPRVHEVSKNDSPPRGLHTLGKELLGRFYELTFTGSHFRSQLQHLGTERALLNHTPFTCRERGIELPPFLFELDTRVEPVKAPGAVGAGSHTEPAADTAVPVHHGDAIARVLERSLGGADPHARRVFAVVTQQQVLPLLQFFADQLVVLGRERVLIMLPPDPLDLILDALESWHVMKLVAGIDAAVKLRMRFETPGVDDHAPAEVGLEGDFLVSGLGTLVGDELRSRVRAAKAKCGNGAAEPF